MLKAEGSGAVCSSVYFEWIIEWIFWKYSIISNFIFLRKNDWQKEGYPVYYVLCSARAQNNKKCASGSVGGARPCQGRGRGFESRLALFLFLGFMRVPRFSEPAFNLHRIAKSFYWRFCIIIPYMLAGRNSRNEEKWRKMRDFFNFHLHVYLACDIV